MPTEFNLYNHTVRVKENPAHDHDSEAYGVADYKANEIRLYVDRVDPSIVEHTFYHELIHFLLHYAGRDDLAGDETLVDTLGGLLAQYEATKRP